ncbi:N-acetyl-gamma-glutamyl-phosphate reductase [Psychrosphaera sp. 1_MG-2023]|uniref:N-acetyl-gamma-glutamyl-phosphate reductase n=1 Tax=Psychrosphaera sp. 1_MG-2023 TaxID=3062643 RepID=UPI0026E39B39|nr:N-acetyl-gamma-glutamyl-phosphate reductase [Psychrosphaera sp. 1_MG-2023]MDO6719536.1 N-acetyl-gamma-glutamyl-phosphate reductase [Psychrosphaera sp. 1_MG-2023]
MTKNKSTIPCLVFGASGYAGVELARMINGHPALELHSLFVSANSADSGKTLSSLYPQYTGIIDHVLVAGTDESIATHLTELNKHTKAFVFLATPHEFSHDIATSLTSENVIVLDLSGGFRLQDKALYPEYYGFEHKFSEQLPAIPYGLVEWNAKALIGKNLISLPGCYPTASQLGLLPLTTNQLLTDTCKPVINAISGVSGAGRKANLGTSFCELSLKPYNLFVHRHMPEIEQGVGREVIFTPHVANFERGILATITVQLKDDVTNDDINNAFSNAYDDQPLVRLRDTIPTIKDVAYTPFCDLYWQKKGNDLIVVSAIDNVLKGAASQGIQCANILMELPQETGLLNQVGGN